MDHSNLYNPKKYRDLESFAIMEKFFIDFVGITP